MKSTIKFRELISYAGLGIIITLVISLLLSTSDGLRGSDIFSGIALFLALGAMLYLRNLQAVSEREVRQRIAKEFSTAEQPLVFESYRHLKARELEGLFLKILDDAQGDLSKVRKLASIAESTSWTSFLEGRW